LVFMTDSFCWLIPMPMRTSTSTLAQKDGGSPSHHVTAWDWYKEIRFLLAHIAILLSSFSPFFSSSCPLNSKTFAKLARRLGKPITML
ncbi:hypothetical protein, partial [Noviherbaspirillum sp. Root189]|uniref:hypothetical protein n=1 Tax=Noviherbaspirillum sp. Root189 TaxID=1736487 RepID=UPI001F45513E